jgi:hypothetical protein
MRKVRFKTILSACALLTVLAAAAPAAADQSNKAAAEALFDEGRRLVGEGKFADACPKFLDSYKLDPATGTLLNLGNCYEKNGQTASAWATYRDTIGEAKSANKLDHMQTATKRANALEPKLSRLTIVAVSPPEGLAVTRDGAKVANAEWGIAFPVDPGTRTIEATAPKKKPWKTTVTVKPDGDKVKIEIPALEDAPPEPTPTPTPTPTTAPQPAPVTAPVVVDAPPADKWSSQKTIALVTGGVGVVGLVVGTIFLVSAGSAYDESLKLCATDEPNRCTQAGADKRGDARTSGNIATIGYGVGIAALVAGVALWVTAPSGSSPRGSSAPRVAVSPTLGGLNVQGVW